MKSTFDEELYTTKLERGPQMKQLEKEAIRIAREIQEEDTKDLHLAEVNSLLILWILLVIWKILQCTYQERGIHFHGDHDLDEEIRFSAVRRDIDSRKFAESENAKLDTYNPNKTLKSAIGRSYSDIAKRGIIDEARALSTCSSVVSLILSF